MPGKQQLLDKPFSLQLFQLHASASVYGHSFSAPSTSRSKPGDWIAKVQLKARSPSVSAENALAGATWNSQPSNSFAQPRRYALSYTFSVAEKQGSEQKAFLNHSLLIAAVKLHLPHRGSVPSISHRRAVTVLTLTAPLQASNWLWKKKPALLCTFPLPHVSHTNHTSALCTFLLSVFLPLIIVFQSRSLKLNLGVSTQGSDRKSNWHR